MKRTIILFILVVFLLLNACREQTKDEVFLQGMEFVSNGNHQAAVTLFKNALEKDPNYIDARLQLGIAYLETGKYDKAESELEKALHQQPDSHPAILNLSKIYLGTNRPEKAIDQLAKLLESDSDNAEALFVLARCHIALNDLPTAERLFRESLLVRPDYAPAQLDLARVLYMTARDDAANQLVDAVLTQNPKNTDAYYLLMRRALSERDRDGAINALIKIRSVKADDVFAAYMLGMLYLDDGQIDAARQIASELRTANPGHPAGYRIEGIVLYQIGDFEAAIQNLQKSTNGMPDLAGYYFLGLANYRFGQFERALSDFQKALDKSPNHDQSRLMVAQTLLKQGRTEDCMREAQLVLERDPENANAHNILASAYMVQGNYDLAMEYIDKAVQINPELAQAHLKKGLFNMALGNKKQGELDLANAVDAAPETLNMRLLLASYYLRQNNYPMASEVIEKGLTITPDSAVLYNLLAAAKFGQNKPDEAIEALNKAKRYKPDYFTPYFNLANYYVSRKDYSAALAEYQAVLQVDPAYVPAMLKAATLHEFLKQDDLAESLYIKAVNSKDPRGYLYLASFQQRKGKSDSALQTLKDGYVSNPDNSELLVSYAAFLKTRGKYDEVIDLYVHLEELRPGAGKPLLLGLYLLKGDYAAAQEITDQVLTDDPSSATGYLFQTAIHEKRSEWQLAETTIQRGISAADNNIDLKLNLARLYSRRGAYDEALNIYDDILRDKPNLIPALFAKASIYDLKGDKKKSENLYEAILDIDENHAFALNNLAVLMLDVYADNKRGLELAAKAFRVKPNVPQIIDTLGYALLKNGETENSIVFLEKASNMLPDEVAIQLHLGQAYKAAGRYDEAVASLTSIREKGASKSELKTAEALLKEMN